MNRVKSDAQTVAMNTQVWVRGLQWKGWGWFVGLCLFYAVAWTPLLAQLVVNDGYSPFIIGSVFIALFLCSRWIANNARSLARVVVFSPFYLALIGAHAAMGIMARWMDVRYFFWAVLLAAVLCIPRFGKFVRPYVMILGMTVAMLVTSWDARNSSLWLMFLGITCVPACWFFVVFMHGSKRLERVSGVVGACFLLGIMLYPRGVVNYKFVFPGLAQRVLEQPGVDAIYDYREPGTLDAMCSQVMFLFPLRDNLGFIAGPQTPCHQLVKLPAIGNAAEKLELWTRGCDNALIDPFDPNVMYMGTIDNILKISIFPFDVVKIVTLKRSIHNVNFLQYDHESDRIFVSYDFGPAISVLDRATLKVVASIPGPDGARTHDVWLDDIGGLVWVSSTDVIGWRINTYRLTDLQPVRQYRWPWDIGFHFTTIDPVNRRGYLGSTATGQVRVLDLDTLTEVARFPLDPGLRNLNFDRGREWTIIGNYFQGRLHVWDSRSMRDIGDVYLGPRVRWVHVDEETGDWYVASSVGGFRIDPDRVFPDLSRSPSS